MKKILLNVLAFTSLFIFGVQMGGSSLFAQQKIDEVQLRKILFTQSAIVNLYVDEVDQQKLSEDAIKGMLEKLDPHSSFTAAKDVQTLTENLNGSFDGIGVQYNMNDDTLVVIQPVSNGPSEKVGIIAGDKIVTVNDSSIAGVNMTREEIMRRLRGPKGTKVNLGVIRQGIKGVQKFTVTRGKIPVYTLDAYYMIDNKTGYIKLGSFGQTTHDEFITATNELFSLGMKDLVIDLQGNGGGYLQAAVEMSDEFLNSGEMIVYTEGRTVGRREYRSSKRKMEIGKVIILVDGYTASAAEILSGAVQDNDRGTIVGRRTFAKGLVQRPIDLPDGSMVRLTVAHYYTPCGRCVQKPYVKGDKKTYENDMLDRLNSGELMSADSIHFPDSLKFTTKGGRTVYGGGGIMPDVYVPLDTTQYTRFHRELSAKGCIIQSTLKYLDKHRKQLIKEYDVNEFRKQLTLKQAKKFYDTDILIRNKSFERFCNEFTVPQELIDILLSKADEAKVTYNDSILQASRPMLDVQLKALLARDLWDMSQYYRIINPTNSIYLKGLEALKEE